MDTELDIKEEGKGAIYLREDGKTLGEMVVGVKDGVLTAYHTEVFEGGEGKGLGKELLNAMVAYAREHQLKVVPVCAYVAAQFKRREEEFADLSPLQPPQ